MPIQNFKSLQVPLTLLSTIIK